AHPRTRRAEGKRARTRGRGRGARRPGTRRAPGACRGTRAARRTLERRGRAPAQGAVLPGAARVRLSPDADAAAAGRGRLAVCPPSQRHLVALRLGLRTVCAVRVLRGTRALSAELRRLRPLWC